MRIYAIPAFQDNYIWTLTDTEHHTAVVVDPGDAQPVLEFLAKHSLKLAGILITHHHFDHTNGIMDLIAHDAVPIWGPATEQITGLTIPVKENDKIHINNFSLSFNVLDIPGHTLGHVAYTGENLLFSGDTLFAAGCGKLFEGTAQQMYTSLNKLASLADDTKIYCGHEYTLANLHFAAIVEPSNVSIKERINKVMALREKNLPTLPALLRDERATNPFLRCHSTELIRRVEQYTNQRLPHALEIFAALRQWKNEFRVN